ncbi:hypothetical protein [Phyllobacterium chamaecytisi]|uniref:hypothetical protein n=1 Tax=Phyllobacterium chamaecytisi TaxID=2876082 RepID=UPI001CCECD77|nr:hypothetical protein [Phyllobacterium sp. KW56]MBZ9603103.1 hypothetical protein [Phyllobacterium sp. KW56]
MLIAIRMPAGDIEYIDADDVLWIREAFDFEWKGARLVRLGDDRLYSIDTLDELVEKLEGGGSKMVEFTPPNAEIKMIANVKKVTDVEKSNPAISHEKAKSVLKFSPKLFLAVRESVKKAKEMIEAALKK